MVAAALLGVAVSTSPTAKADTLYRQNSGAGTTLDTATFTPAAPGSIIQNYAEGSAFTTADDIIFGNFITAATTFRVSATTATNLQVYGLTIGSLFNGTLLNPGGAITIQNASNASGGAAIANTITLGAGGIDMFRAGQNLTISRDATVATNAMTVALGAAQTWRVNLGRTLTVSNDITTGGNALTIRGGVAGAGAVVLGSTTGSITGGGALIIEGMNVLTGNTVTLSGNNGVAGLGAATVGGGSQLNIDQSAASQNKLNDTAALTLNRATLNLQGTGAGTETVGSLVLGGTFNAITRSAGTGVLGAGAITRSAGAVLNVGVASIATTSRANVNGVLGGWAVINQTDFATNAFAAIAATTTGEASWTSALNEVQTANLTLTGARAVNTLKFNGAAAQTFGLGGFTLNVTSGGLIRNQNLTTTISNGTLTAGGTADAVADELFLWNHQSTLTVSAVIADNGSDVVNLVKAGAGSVTLSGVNTYTGTTTVAQGTLNFGDNAVGGNVATFGAGSAIINDGLIQINKTSAATLAQRTISQNISGAGSLNNLRAGTFILSGTNTYYGDTTVTLGTLQAGSAGGFSPNSRLILNVAGVGAVVDPLVASDVGVSALRGDQSTAFFTLSAGNLILSGVDPTSGGTAQNYQGIISGAGGIVKNNTFTQNFTAGGALTYTGVTTVNNGVLQFNKGSATTGLTVAGPGLVIANAANITAASANLSLTGAASTLQVNGGFNQAFATLTGVTDSRITLGAASNLLSTDVTGGTFAGVISGAGSFTKAGVGTLVLTGGNAHTGATTINAGTLQVGAANSVQIIGDRSAVVIGAAGTLDLNGNSETVGSLAGAAGASVLMGAGTLTVGRDDTSTDYSGVISGTGGLNKVGTGIQTLTGANTFTGAVTITSLGGQIGGGVALGAGGSLADTVSVRNSGWYTTFIANASDSLGSLTGTRNTTLMLGAGATLTSSYADGTATALAATADSASANGRIIRNINTAGLKAGDLISGTGATAPSYIVQVIDNDTVLVNQNVPTGPTVDFAPTVTSVGVLSSDLTGLGGFTKDGAGTLVLTGNSTHYGATTINAGTVQVGGIWNGQKFSLHDTLSDNSQLVFASTGTQVLNFANSSTNLLSFERIGSLAGGSATTTINLTSGSNVAVLALGGDNASSTFSGQFLPGNSEGYLIKEGTGNFTWNNATANVFDGPVFVENGTFTAAGAQGLDASNEVYMTNRGTALVVTTAGGETIPFLQGGKGDTRVVLGTGYRPAGGLTSNYIVSVSPVVTLTTSLTLNLNTAFNLATLDGVHTFNGDFTGAATLAKTGLHLFRLTGTSTNSFTGETQITGGTLQMGVLSRSAGVGAISGSDVFGTLSSATGLRLTGGILDLNGTSQTVTRINATSTAGTIALGAGSLTLSNQNTQSTGTTLTGTATAVLNINASATSTLTMTGNSNTFNGTYNVGANAALTVNLAAGVLGDAARLNLNGTGTQLTVTLADTVGSLAGTGNAVLTQGLSIREGWSGTSAVAAYAGSTSGAGALTLSGFGGLTLSGNLAHTGGLTLANNASLNLNYGGGNNILPGTGTLTLNAGTLRVISTDYVAAVLESVAATSLGAGASTLRSLGASTGYHGNGLDFINLAAIARSAGGTVDFGRNAAAATNANTNGILGGYASYDGTTWAVANAGTAAITGLGSFSADVFGAGLHVDVTAAGDNAGGLADTLRFSGAGAANITGATTIASGGVLNLRSVGANVSTISGALNATGNELIIHQHNPLGDLVLSNVGGTNTAITTAGGGRTLLTNDIAGTGVTSIGYGYLQLGGSVAGGSSTGMVGSGAILNNGTLGINRSNALSIGAAVISGTGNFEQLGDGTTTLGAANTYQGRTTVRRGVLEVTNNAGLGLAASGVTNRWANLTSVDAGGVLQLNVAAGGIISELLSLDGGTLDLRSAVATTLDAAITLPGDSTIRVSNSGAAVSHIISGEIFALPGADLSFTGVGGATPSTLILAPAATTGARWGDTSVGAGAIVQVGTLAGARGFLGVGSLSIASGGTLAISTNDNYVIDNAISGAGTLAINRNANYLTGDLSAFSGTLFVTPASGQNVNVSAELGNDTYGSSFGTGAVTVTASAFAGTSGISSVRTHFNQDVTLSNTFNLNPANDATNAKNAQLIRAGLGNVTLSGTVNLGATNAGTGAQRNLIQTEGGGALFLDATIVGGGANNLLNITNNNIVVMGGSVSRSYHGVLSGNNNWVFENTGITTLLGVNTFNTGNSYLRAGTLAVGTGGVDTIHNDNDLTVLSGATLTLIGNETIGVLQTQKGATINLGANTLTLDDDVAGMMNGTVSGTGSLVLGNYVAMYGTNSATGTLTLGTGTTSGTVQTPNLTNALGSFTTINLGAAGNTGAANIEYVGPGETFAKNLNLSGTTAAVRITANGTGGLTLSGNITNTGGGSKTLTLSGQTGGYFNPVMNRITGAITEAANVISLSMPATGEDDRFGVTGRWALTNAGNDFSGGVTVGVGMLEFAGDLKTGVEATSVAGDLSVARTFQLSNNNFNGRRYDMYGSGDQLADAGYSQGTNTLTPSGSVGTVIFNDPNAGTANLTNITWAMPNVSTTNTSGMQLINNGAKQVNLFNAFNFGTTGARVVVLDGSNTLSNTVNGIIANPGTSQATRIDKEGAGTWRLAGANTHTGGTNINDGILELAGGSAIADAQTVAINGDGGDGVFSGTAKLRIINSETIGLLTGDILTEAEILSGQTLTIAAGNSTMSGLITGAGNLAVSKAGTTGGTLTTTARNTYTGITTLGATGAATANAGISITQLADGGLASGLGASSNAATNLIFTTSTAGTNGGILTWTGLTSQTTDRLFTMGLGAAGARINASGTLVGTNQPAMTWSNTGAVVMTGSGARTLILGGTGIVDNVFRPALTDGGGATTLSKVDVGIWMIDPAAGANTFTGGVSITGGTLAIKAGNALGTGTITINGAAGVGLEIREGITLANAITNSTAFGGFRATSGVSTLTGLVTSSATLRLTVDAGASININNATSALTGAGGIFKLGAGNLTFSGTHGAGWTGTTELRSGTLTLDYGTNNTSKLADAAALTLGGIGAITITGVDSDVGGQGNLIGSLGGTISLSGGSHAETVLSTTIDQGANAIIRASGTSTINLNVITRGSSQGTIDFGAASIATTDTSDVNGILGVGYATVAKTDWARSATTAADSAITALATYAVDTYGATNNVDVTSYAAVGSAANTLRFNNAAGGTLTLTGAFAMTGGGLLMTPNVTGGDVVITGGQIQNAANTAGLEALIIHQHSAKALQIDSVIQNNTNAQALTKTGTGTLYLGGLNTFTGNINLYGGTMQVGGTAAAPTVATNAFLSGLSATPAANASAAWNLAAGTTLRFLTTNTTIYNAPVVAGDGTIELATGNQGVLQLDDNNENFVGTLNFNGGTIRVGNQANALGRVSGLFNLGGSVNFIYTAGVTNNKVTTYAEGTTVNFQNNTTTSTGTWSGVQRFNNTTLAGVTFNLPAPTTSGTVGLNISGVIYGTNGFTKTGNGILQLSATNFTDVYGGYTSANDTPSLSGQIAVSGGALYVGGARALGAHGAGNEVLVAAGASLDLRGQALNYNDDSDLVRKLIHLSGTGFTNAQGNATGALRNSSGTGQTAHVKLLADSLINSGGTVNGSLLIIGTFDSNLGNANSLSGAFTRNASVIDGGGFALAVQGGRAGTDNFIIADPSFASALGKLVIQEGGSRFRHEITANIGGAAGVAITAANITGGVEIAYAGLSAADLTGAQVGGQGNTTSILGANVGARLLFDNWFGTRHSVNLIMNGVAAAAATGTPGGARSAQGGHNVLQADFFTIPDGATYLDGTLSLAGTANRNLIINDSVGNYSVVEQGNLVVAPATKLVFGGVVSGAGGFSKQGQADVRFTANNTFSGDVNVLRIGTSAAPWESHTYRINGVDYATNGLGEGWAEWSLTLNGAAGAFSDVANVNLQRRGMLTLDNTNRLAPTSGVSGGSNANRIADDAVINMHHGWFRLNTGTATVTEALGTVNAVAGTNIVDLYGTDGAGVLTSLSIATLERTAGAALRFTNLDASSTFGVAAVGDSARVSVGTLGAGAALVGGGGAANSTTLSVAQGVFGGNIPIALDSDFRLIGFNNGNLTDLWNVQRNLQFAAGSHFMTVDGGFLRPLDDDEYFTAPTGVINPGTLTTIHQNVNLSDVVTVMSESSTVNALRLGSLTDHDGTGATSLIRHHSISLFVDGTLKVSSGMLSSGYWTAGNTASSTTQLVGGALDFNGKEAIINNQNAFFRLTDGTIQGGDFNIASAITNAAGLTKTGFSRVNLLGANTYAGITTVSEGLLDGRHGRTSFGLGGDGNGIVVLGSAELRTNYGMSVGSASAREDIYVGILAGDQRIMNVENDLTQWFSNVTIDNVDAAGHTIFTPRIRAENSATSLIMGHIAGGDTKITNDILVIDPRTVEFNSAGNNVFIVRGQFGDRYVGGVPVPIADPISQLPTLAGVRTNENEVLRVNLGGGTDETNLILDRNYNSAGRLTVVRGTLIVNFDPASVDGSGFWTADAISKIPNADSVTTAFNVNGSTVQQGFILGTATNNYGAVILARPGQVFNMASWTMAGTGAKHIGGINESGSVTFGDGTGSLTAAGAVPNLYAADGGTVVFNQRITGNIGTAPSSFGFLKSGRGQVTLQNSSLASAGDANFVLGGGILLLNHTGTTVQALVGGLNARFDGGTVISKASSGANTTTAFATNDAADRVLNFSLGGNEIVACTVNTGTARNMTINMGNANSNGTTASSNFTRSLGATANLVEDSTAGGTAQITLQFNSATTAAVKNQVIPWMTYGTLGRTASDFAMSDAGSSNDVRAYTRALDEYQNNVAIWAANQDVSENSGAGFYGNLGAALTLSTLRFDANADSVVNLGTNVLTVAGNGLATSGGGILVSSNVGSANKTISGGVGAGLTTSGGRVELIVHHYGAGNLNLNVPVTGAGVDLVIAGPSTTNASTIGKTGAVVLGAAGTYDGQTFINGAVLSFSNANQLGTNASASAVVMNGGTLRYTGTGMMSLGSKGIDFQGNGGTLDVSDGAGELYLDTAVTSNAVYRGDLIKVGAGTLTLNGAAAAFGSAGNPGFLGLIDVRQGTLRLAVDHGNNTAGNETSEFNTALGSSNTFMDGTVFRSGTNLAIQMGNANNAGGYSIGEWLTFEGNNYVSAGTINSGVDGNTADAAGATELSAPVPNPNNRRPVNLNGVNTIKGTTVFDVVNGQTLRLNNGGVGYTTGAGDIIKDGQGTLTIGTNIPDYTGAITILQGRLYAAGQADNLGTGYTVANGSKFITLGSVSRQGIAEFCATSDNIAGATFELNHDLRVVYNPAQSKRLLIETFANGSQIELNGSVTLNDNLIVYINDAAETGGSANYVNLNGRLLDGATTSGNLVLASDDTGNANDNTNGRVNNFLVLRNDNSLWTGDVRISIHTSFDQDENAILRLESANALGVANDVDMGFNSILQVGGNGSSGLSGATSGNRIIGSLSTNGGVGPFLGGSAGGTMGASANGVSVVIENAATTSGTLVITQSTPASTETVWNAHFRDGTLNSEFFAPGAGTLPSAALNIVKAGGGWATLQTDNAHTGTTTVNAGTLQVGRGGVGDTGAAGVAGTRFTSVAGTIVAGTGIIQGDASIGGSLRPGDEAGAALGTLVINGGLTLAASAEATLQLKRASYTAMNVVGIHGAAYGTWNANHVTDSIYGHLLNDPVTAAQHDKLLVTGALTVAGGGKLSLSNMGYNPTAGDVVNVADWAGAALSLNLGGTVYNGGRFRTGAETGTDLNLFELGYGLLWDVSQFNATGNLLVVEAASRNFYWNGDQSAVWSAANSGNTNWLDAPAGQDNTGVPAFTDNLYLAANTASNLTTTLGRDFTVNSITFTGTGTSNTAGFTVAGDTLTLSAREGRGLIVQAGSGANTISSNVVLGATQTWTSNETTNVTTVSGVISGLNSGLTKAGAGTIALSGSNSYGGATQVDGGVLQLGAGGTGGSLNIASTINVGAGATFAVRQSDTVTQGTDFSGAGIAGAGGVSQAGTGTLILSATNTYTGSTTVSGGTLNASAGALSATSGITVNGATLTAVNYNAAATLSLNASGVATISGSGLTITGAVSNANTATDSLLFSAATGTATLTSLGGAGKTRFASNASIGTLSAGTVTVDGSSATITTLNGGNIVLGTTALSVSDGTHAGVISGATGTLTKSGAGTLILSGANTFGGAITISAGKLQIGAGSTTGSIGAGAIANSGILEINRSDNLSLANVISGTGSLTKSAAGTLTLATANTFEGGVTVSANGGTVIVGHNNALGTGTVTLAGNNAQLTLLDGITVANAMSLTSTGGLQPRTVRLQTGATSATFAGSITNSSANTDSLSLTFSAEASGTLTVSGNISGKGFVKTGAGTVILSGANTYTGATTISAGTLSAAAGALASTSGISVNGAILAAANYNLAATLALDSTATASISGAILSITGAITNAGTTADALNFSASTGIITLSSLAGAGKTRFGSDADVLGGISVGTVTVVGALGANITGGTVNAGSLAGAISGGNVTVTNLLTGGVSAGTVNAGSLTGNVSGGAVTVTGALTGNVTAGTVSAGSMAGNVGSSVTISGLLNGEITAGTNSLGSLTSASVTGGTNTITGTATVTTVNGGTTTIGGVANITTLTTGTLNLNGATSSIGTLTDGTVNLGTTALTVNDGTFAGLLAGANGSLIKATSGILTLTGANTYGAGTTINLGTLIVGNVGSLGSGAVTVANGATLNLAGFGVTNAITVATGGTIEGGPTAASAAVVAALSGTNSINTVLTGTTGLAKDGSGELSLTTPNFFTGAVTANTAGAVIKAAFLSDTSSSLGASDLSVPSNLTLGSGAKLEFNGSTNTSTARSFTIGGSAGIAATGTGTLEFTSTSNFATTGDTPALTLTANNAAAGENRFASSLAGGSTPLAVLAIDGIGTWVIGGNSNRFKGDIRIDAGAGSTIGLENNALPSGATLAVANNATIRWEAGNTTAVKLEIVAGTAAKLNLGSNNVVFSTAPVVASGSGTTANFEKQGTGTLTIAASVNAGAFNFSLPANSGMLSVGTGGTVGNVSLAIDSKLGGTGTVGDITAASGSTIGPGNSPGTLSTGTIAMPGGSIFEWQVQDATDPVAGYDTLAISGNLDLRGASASSKVIFKVQSLLGTGNGTTLGDPLNFDPPAGASSIRVFNFATVGGNVLTTGGLQISDVFQFDVSQFTYSDGSLSNAGLWSINWDSANHLVTVTAVPEPSTYGFGLGALALAAAAIRRRKRQATKA